MLDLCAGIGGFSLAASWAGIDVVGQVEIDPFCQRVLAKHWPDVKRMGDLWNVRGDEFGPVDLITAGIPCQPHSLAGKRRGTADDRWLWPAVCSVLSVAKPTWIVIENVYGFLSLGFDHVLSDLEALDYEVGTLVLPAAGVGAPHRRDRVWIVAHAARQCVDGSGDTGSGRWPESANGNGRQALSGLGEPTARLPGWMVGPGIVNAWADDWEAGMSRTTELEPDRVNKLKALGNAIVPQVAYVILAAMQEADSCLTEEGES